MKITFDSQFINKKKIEEFSELSCLAMYFNILLYLLCHFHIMKLEVLIPPHPADPPFSQGQGEEEFGV